MEARTISTTTKVKTLFSLFALLVSSGCSEWRMKQKLLAVDGVIEVTDVRAYESRIEAQVFLSNGGTIWLDRLNDQQFEETNEIFVIEIGDIYISCEYPNSSGFSASGFNILTVVDQIAGPFASDKKPEIINLAELFNNYDYVLSTVRLLPEKGSAAGARIIFDIPESPEWICHKVVQSR